MSKILLFFLLVFNIIATGCVSDNGTSFSVNEKNDDNEIVIEENIIEETITGKESETEKSHSVNKDFSGVDNRGSGWGFVKKKNTEPEIYKSTQEMFAKYNTYYLDPKREKKIYLTFDEGYENGYTSVILDVLKEKEVPAAFFITGPYLEKECELVDRMVNEGHIVGNHTVNHPNLHKLEEAQKMADELGGLNTKFFEKYGKNMNYMRPPEGEYSERLLAVANELGYKTIFWSFAYKDWDVNSQKGAEYAFEQVTPYLHNGAILLLHAVSKDNAESLGDIIDYAKEQGYRFASLDELKEC